MSHPRFSPSCSSSRQISAPLFGDRATTMPRVNPPTRAFGAAMTTSARPSPETSGIGITQ
jgi:hypothetical protein